MWDTVSAFHSVSTKPDQGQMVDEVLSVDLNDCVARYLAAVFLTTLDRLSPPSSHGPSSRRGQSTRSPVSDIARPTAAPSAERRTSRRVPPHATAAPLRSKRQAHRSKCGSHHRGSSANIQPARALAIGNLLREHTEGRRPRLRSPAVLRRSVTGRRRASSPSLPSTGTRPASSRRLSSGSPPCACSVGTTRRTPLKLTLPPDRRDYAVHRTRMITGRQCKASPDPEPVRPTPLHCAQPEPGAV
jgi:hypothetical protein